MKEEWTGAPNSSQLSNTRFKVKEDKMNRNRFLNKYLLLALILTALFAMTGCRTRITNNSEVSNVYYDEDGFLSETYQMRRDELGLSTAESPIFPDLGSGETEDDFDSSEESGLNYEPEEDTYVEPPTTTTTTPSTTRHYSSPSRRYSSPSNSTTTTTYKVTLDPGEGAFEGKSKGNKLTQNIQKNKEFNLPESDVVTRKNYKLSGWKEGSTTHKPGAKITVTKDVTYTAVWKAAEEKTTKDDNNKKKNTFTVTFEDGQGNVLKTQNVKKGKSATAPDNPKRDGYRFKGWDKEFNKVTSDLTVKATWEKEVTEKYTVTVNTRGGTLKGGEIEASYEKGKSFNLPGAERDDGFTLKAWVVNGETKKVGSNVPVNEELTIEAEWTVNPSYWDDRIDNAEKDKKYYSENEESVFTQCIGDYIKNPTADDDYYAVAFAKNADKAKDAKKKLVDKGIAESKIRIFSEPPKDTDELILYKLRLHKAIYSDDDLGIGTVEDATGLKSEDYFEEFK